MSKKEKSEKLRKKLESHLRRTSRQLVKFNTLDETLHYLIKIFWMEFTCDFAAIMLKENQQLIPKVWKGEKADVENVLRVPLEDVSHELMEHTAWWQMEMLDMEKECRFVKTLQKEEGLSTWFTVPLKEDTRSFGFLVVGFRNFVPIIMELEQALIEFGKDVAVAMVLAMEKESEKRKIKGIEWLRENIFDHSSMEQLIQRIVTQAGNGTRAKAASIYLYDETQNMFIFQPPAYGDARLPETIRMRDNKSLQEYFPYLEKTGGEEITVPLVVNLKTIGVLHVIHERGDAFTDSDLQLLDFLSTHVSAMIENARLYNNEIKDKKRLRTFMAHHQQLVKKTVDGEDFDEITETLHHIFNKPIILLDRFFRPVSYNVSDETILQRWIETISARKEKLKTLRSGEKWLTFRQGDKDEYIGVWAVIGGGDLLGYLTMLVEQKKVVSDLRLTLDYALNVYAIQFVKKKLVMDTQEQLKDHLINQLFNEKIEDRQKLLDYTHLLNWNLFHPHRVGVLKIVLQKPENQEMDLLDFEAKKTFIWDKMKDHLAIFYDDIILSRKGSDFIIMVPEERESSGAGSFWKMLFDKIKEIARYESAQARLFLGIGDLTKKLEDYYISYRKAEQTLNIIEHRFEENGYAFFEEMGAYTVLFNKRLTFNEKMFLKKYLFPILQYSKGKEIDLFHTLRLYLTMNKNMNQTAKALYIHRSTLKYRLDKISELLKIDLEDAEEAFNLMMAYKLYDLHYTSLNIAEL